jgi:hypothetical protein
MTETKLKYLDSLIRLSIFHFYEKYYDSAKKWYVDDIISDFVTLELAIRVNKHSPFKHLGQCGIYRRVPILEDIKLQNEISPPQDFDSQSYQADLSIWEKPGMSCFDNSETPKAIHYPLVIMAWGYKTDSNTKNNSINKKRQWLTAFAKEKHETLCYVVKFDARVNPARFEFIQIC